MKAPAIESEKKVELVVARYTEDLGWLRNVDSRCRISVYTKGTEWEGAVALPNHGREAQTYLHHLLSRYDEAAEWTVFCQGFPFDHVPEFHRFVRRIADGLLPPPGLIWMGLFVDWDRGDGQRLFSSWSKNADRHGLELDQFWKLLFEEEPPCRFVFFPGAQFALHRSVWWQRPKSFYARALSLSEEFPDAAHCFERCWDRVFGLCALPEPVREGELPIYLRPVKRLGITWKNCARIPGHPFYSEVKRSPKP